MGKLGESTIIYIGCDIMTCLYRGTVCSDLKIIKCFIEDKLEILGGIIENNDILFDVKVILNELIVNGALHGNQSVSSKCITLALEIDDNKLIIEVIDEGKGLNFSLDEYDPLQLKASGRGLVLVNGLSDQLIVDKNRVIAIKNIQ